MTDEQLTPESSEKKKSPFGQILIWGSLIILMGIVAIQLMKSQQGSIEIGKPAPEFVLTSFEGQDYASEELRGKVLVVNFWASWCNPCELEAEDLQTAWEMYEPTGEVLFLGVDWTDTDREAQAYMEKFGITYPNGPDYGTRISQAYRTSGVPETYIIDKDGILAYVKLGPFSSLQEILAAIDPLIGQ